MTNNYNQSKQDNFDINESKIEAVGPITYTGVDHTGPVYTGGDIGGVIEDPSYTDVIYETLQDTRRHIIRLEKEAYEKDAEIRSLKERIKSNRNTMDAMIKMAGGR